MPEWNISWDQADRNYHTGIDRCVLYPADDIGVAWNGIRSVTVNPGQIEPQGLYLDGLRYFNNQSGGRFSATLSAFMYPDEFERFDGAIEYAPGLTLDGQTSDRFGLSYRTKTAKGYRIHLMYNLLAVAADKTFTTLATDVAPVDFSWTITGIPCEFPGFKPTEYFVFDSEEMSPGLLGQFEGLLYGTENNPPELPSIGTFMSLAEYWDPQQIVPQTDGVALLVDDPYGDLTPSNEEGFYLATPDTGLKKTNVDGLFELE